MFWKFPKKNVVKLNGQGSVSVGSDLHFLMVDEEIYL